MVNLLKSHDNLHGITYLHANVVQRRKQTYAILFNMFTSNLIIVGFFFQKTSKTGGVGKMTDTSQYTGAHKERFGADGKGE